MVRQIFCLINLYHVLSNRDQWNVEIEHHFSTSFSCRLYIMVRISACKTKSKSDTSFIDTPSNSIVSNCSVYSKSNPTMRPIDPLATPTSTPLFQII